MKINFIGHDSTDTPCTTTALDVTPISLEEYDDPSISTEIAAFKDGRMDFVKINAEAVGFARSHGGGAAQNAPYIHNRLFMAADNPAEHLDLCTAYNTGEGLSLVSLPAGTRLAIGYIANGKGMQARISKSDLSIVEFRKRS